MKSLLLTLAAASLSFSFAPAVRAQEASSGAGSAPAGSSTPHSERVGDLMGRIHDLRMSLLLGGDSVRRAESEAIDFYGSKAQAVASRLDSIQVDLSEKRAAYDVALDDALGAVEPAARATATDRAAALGREIRSLETEADGLHTRRQNLSRLVAAVQARGRERDSLAAQLEASGDFDDELFLPSGGLGLAPAVAKEASASPFDDERLIQDLLERDPVRARRLLFDADPARYWKRFPLSPPFAALQRALTFPLPDLPEQR